jgi:hypothetical protein
MSPFAAHFTCPMNSRQFLRAANLSFPLGRSREKAMIKKIAGLAVTAVSAAVLLAGTPAAAAETHEFPPPGCDSYRYNFLWGEGVSMLCYALPGPSHTYRVVAHCVSGASYWFTVGRWVPLGFGPSVAECNGGLLWSAYVADYHVENF